MTQIRVENILFLYVMFRITYLDGDAVVKKTDDQVQMELKIKF